MGSTATDGRPRRSSSSIRTATSPRLRSGWCPSRRDNVVYLDVSERARPFGLNLLDVGLGWDRDKAVSNALAIFRREFDRFWGPRMEDAFRFALLTLFEANQAICAAGPSVEPPAHHPPGADPPRRRRVSAEHPELVSDPIIKDWWSGY